MTRERNNQAHSALLIGGVLLLGITILGFAGPISANLRLNSAYIRLNAALAAEKDMALDASANELGGLLIHAPDEKSVWRGIALARQAQGQLDVAAEAYAHVENNETELVTWGKRAELEQQWATAQDWYHIAVLLEPEKGDHLYRLAQAAAEQGLPEATDYYARALVAPLRSEFGRSNILTRMGELEKQKNAPIIWRDVLALYDEAIQQDEFVDQSDIIQAWLGKAEALERLGQSYAALEAYQWLAAYSPGHYWANIHAGRLSWQVESDHPQAISYLEKAIAIDARPKWAYLYLGQMYAQSGDGERAIPLLRKVLEIDPEDRAARSQLSKLEDGDGS